MPDLADDVAALLLPLPVPLPADADEAERAALEAHRDQLLVERSDTVARLQEAWDLRDEDPLLLALGEQARIKEEVERRIRRLVALAREFVGPRPYPWEVLAEAMRTSTSKVRGAYDHLDVEVVASIIGRRSTVAQSPADDAGLAELVAGLEARTPAPAKAQVAGVAAALREQGWTPYPPVPRTANPKYARRYVRWERRWPKGTTISLYQEPAGFLGVHAKMATDDPRWFCESYGWGDEGDEVTADDVAKALTAYGERVACFDADRRRHGDG
jgi:hypothetical protein